MLRSPSVAPRDTPGVLAGPAATPRPATSIPAPLATTVVSLGPHARAATWLVVVPLLALAWLLRLVTIAPYELGTDGGLSVGLALGPLHELFAFSARDVHPPLYYLLLRGWIGVAGLSWVSLKWLGAAAGALTVAATARWLRSAAGGVAAFVAAAALALAPSAVIAGASVRDFACGLAATMLATLAFWMLLQRPARAPSLLLAGATAAAGWLWYFHLPVFLVQLGLAITWRQARSARLPLLLGAAAWLPWLGIAAPPLVGKLAAGIDSFGGPHLAGGRPAAEVVAVAAGWYPGDVPAQLAAALVLGMAVVGLVAGWRRKLRTFCLLWTACALGGSLVLWYVNGHWDPQAGIDRYGLVILPFLAAGTVTATRRWPGLTLILALWLTICLPSLAPMPRSASARPWPDDPALDRVVQSWQPGDAAAFESIDRLGYFALRGGAVAFAFAAEDNGSAFRQSGDRERIAQALPSLEARHARIWYVSDGSKPGTLLQHVLDTSATLQATWPTPAGAVRLYSTRRP